jgi:hypothetical protein
MPTGSNREKESSDQHSASTAGLYAHREQQKKIDEQSDKAQRKMFLWII